MRHDYKRESVTTDKSHYRNSKKQQASGRGAAPASSSARSEKTKSAPPPPPPPRTGCWLCKGNHWVRDCSTAIGEYKTAAIDRMKPVCDATKAKKLVPASTVDSGATTCYIPRQSLGELRELSASVTVQPLEQDVGVNVAGGDTIVCHDKTKLNLRLPTIAGPVHLRDAACIVLEAREGEFILGNYMLVSFGIDVNAQLSGLLANVDGHLEAVVAAAGENKFSYEVLPMLGDLFRLTIDYRPVNAFTVPITGATPDLEATALNAQGVY
ncbi:hypothetical protein PHMEG_00016993 [Phytophthora megakarya]|uniref:Uncharacterized protein n=1 Tax=Phytophthora megakarya TaxID=4795 RepID=A0A225VXU6_9STRA|nr:hypothetical protein PHMEG_00016993 [Phytophthora megakarya]